MDGYKEVFETQQESYLWIYGGAIACTSLVQAHARPNSSMKMEVGPQVHPLTMKLWAINCYLLRRNISFWVFFLPLRV